ncbi:MAG: hypothetical protein EOM20_21115 [Spartobacteria bacterium]|nr:hypothetical protein [Spartobacteria bacterium]
MSKKNKPEKVKEEFKGTFFATPWVGTLFTVLSGLSFMFLMMILPIVGKAARHGSGSPGAYRAPWYNANVAGFLTVLFLSFLLSVLAIISKRERSKIDNSPKPYVSYGLCVVCILLLVALMTGALGA